MGTWLLQLWHNRPTKQLRSKNTTIRKFKELLENLVNLCLWTLNAYKDDVFIGGKEFVVVTSSIFIG